MFLIEDRECCLCAVIALLTPVRVRVGEEAAPQVHGVLVAVCGTIHCHARVEMGNRVIAVVLLYIECVVDEYSAGVESVFTGVEQIRWSSQQSTLTLNVLVENCVIRIPCRMRCPIRIEHSCGMLGARSLSGLGSHVSIHRMHKQQVSVRCHLQIRREVVVLLVVFVAQSAGFTLR